MVTGQNVCDWNVEDNDPFKRRDSIWRTPPRWSESYTGSTSTTSSIRMKGIQIWIKQCLIWKLRKETPRGEAKSSDKWLIKKTKALERPGI